MSQLIALTSRLAGGSVRLSESPEGVSVGGFDRGPSARFAELFANPPDYSRFKKHFWYDWGPVIYRGRLDGSARVLCVASDPGPTERVAGRPLVGDAGQRVQGFLAKIGLTRSYLCLNAFIYALFPSHGEDAPEILSDPDQTAWRNKVFDAARTPKLQAVVAFGLNAQKAVELWQGKAGLEVRNVPHPSSRDSTEMLARWRAAVIKLRGIVTPDPDGVPLPPNFVTTQFRESDYRPIPREDLPFGVPSWLGDDAWGRNSHPRHNNSVSRPSPDDRHTLIWIAPRTD